MAWGNGSKETRLYTPTSTAGDLLVEQETRSVQVSRVDTQGPPRGRNWKKFQEKIQNNREGDAGKIRDGMGSQGKRWSLRVVWLCLFMCVQTRFQEGEVTP